MTDRPPVSGEPSTERCDAVLAYCALPMRHEGTHQYPHAAIEARATPPSLDVERLVATIDKHALFYDDIGEVFCECDEWDGSNSWAEHLAARLTSKEERP